MMDETMRKRLNVPPAKGTDLFATCDADGRVNGLWVVVGRGHDRFLGEMLNGRWRLHFDLDGQVLEPVEYQGQYNVCHVPSEAEVESLWMALNGYNEVIQNIQQHLDKEQT